MKPWNAEAQNELDQILNQMNALYQRLDQLVKDDWYRQRRNHMVIHTLRLKTELDELAEY